MHKCDKCNKDFTLKKNLTRHLKNVHQMFHESKRSINAKQPKHSCPVCQLAFVERSSLRRHERIKHKMNFTTAINNKKSIKCATFEPSNLDDYPLLKELIPDEYVYHVHDLDILEDDELRAKFEIADCAEDMFLVWLSELEQKSKVTYRVKSFTKSPSPKIVFNKVYRCVHNTFPNKYCVPHPKHTGCLATLTVRIKKCSEALSVKNTMANNNVIMIPLKAIVTLNHCHNHILEPIKLHCSIKEKESKQNRIHLNKNLNNSINDFKVNNNLSEVNSNESNCSNISSSTQASIKDNVYGINTPELIEDSSIFYESEKNKFAINDNIQNIENDFELSEEFDNFILVENINTVNSLHDNENFDTLHQLLSDFDTVNEKMLQQFESNPEYFLSAIKAYTSAMKNNLASKESLLNMLNSFGKYLLEDNADISK